MAQRITVWHGTDKDLKKLKAAVQRYCDCPVAASEDPRPSTCPAHEMLTDQTVIDHLAFVGVNRHAYWHGEFDPQAEWF